MEPFSTFEWKKSKQRNLQIQPTLQNKVACSFYKSLQQYLDNQNKNKI